MKHILLINGGIKRTISLILAILMLLSSATLMFACKDGDDKSNSSSVGENKTYEEDSIFYERSLVEDGLGEADYGGRELRIVSYTPTEIEVLDEERNQGNLIKDSRFSRNEAVENRFNVKLKVVYTGTYTEQNDYVSKTVLSGNDEFDLFMGMVMSMGGMVTKKLFLNWYDVEHIDFSKPWWYESNSTDLTYNGKNIIAISHLNQTAVGGAYCLYYNKNLAAAYELGDLYELVLDGKWTFDKLSEMIKDIYTDDGNDKRDAGDFYGFGLDQGTCLNSFLWAFDNPVCTKDEDGVPQITVKTDKIDSIINDMYDFCYNNKGVFFEGDKKDLESIAGDLFYEKKAIFKIGTVYGATNENMRSFEDEYGMIPLPKYTEDQPNYKTMVGGHHTALAIPKTCKDTEFVGRIVEALSAESWKIVTPTLYEIALKTRYLRDSESKIIMDMIIEGVQFDFGTVYDNWQGFAFMLQRMMAAGNNNFQSYYTTRLPNAKYQIKTIVKAFDRM